MKASTIAVRSLILINKVLLVDRMVVTATVHESLWYIVTVTEYSVLAVVVIDGYIVHCNRRLHSTLVAYIR